MLVTILTSGRCPPPSVAGRVLLGLAVVSWCGLMAPLLTAGPLVLDEHCSYWTIEAGIPGTSWGRSLDYAAMPPLSCWIQQLFLTVLGKSELVFRLPSALAFLGAIIAVYGLGRDVQHEFAGGLAALLLAWHPEAMDEVRIGRCYGLVLLLATGVVWSTRHWLRQRRSWSAGLIWSLLSAALLWTHYTPALLVIVTGAMVVLTILRERPLDRQAVLMAGLSLLLLVVLCFPLLAPVTRLREWGPYLNFSATGVTIWQVIGPIWWLGLPAATFPLMFGRKLSDLSSLCRDRTLWLLAACSLLPLLAMFMLSSGELSSLANPRYRVAYVPAGCVLLAVLWTGQRRWWVSIPVAVLVTAGAWLWEPQRPWQPGRLGSLADRDWFALSQELLIQSRAGEPLYVQSGLVEGFLVPAFSNDDAFLEYVACRVSRFYVETPHPRIALPFLWSAETEAAADYKHRLQQGPDTLWIAAATDTDLNRRSLFDFQSLAKSQGFRPVDQHTWSNAVLLKYQRTSD